MSKSVEGVKKSYPYSGKKFKCPYCGKKFKRLKLHIRKKHYKIHLRMTKYSILYWLLRKTLVFRNWVVLPERDLKSWITSWSVLHDALDELEEEGLVDPEYVRFSSVSLSPKLVEILVREYEKAESK